MLIAVICVTVSVTVISSLTFTIIVIMNSKVAQNFGLAKMISIYTNFRIEYTTKASFRQTYMWHILRENIESLHIVEWHWSLSCERLKFNQIILINHLGSFSFVLSYTITWLIEQYQIHRRVRAEMYHIHCVVIFSKIGYCGFFCFLYWIIFSVIFEWRWKLHQ